MMRTGRVVFLAVVTGALFAGLEAGAQTAGPTPGPADTLQARVAQRQIDTKYFGGIKGDVNQMSLGNRFTLQMAFPIGITSVTTLSADESSYRLQDRRDENASFVSNLVYPVKPGFMVDGSISSTRYFNRVITFTNATQDLFNNVQKAQGNAQYSQPLPLGLALNTRTSLSLNRSQQTFLNDQTASGGLGAGVQYAPSRFIHASAKVFGGRATQNAESGGRNFSGLGAKEDSVLARVRVVLRDSVEVSSEYSRFTSRQEYLELPRGAYGDISFSDTVQVTPEQNSKDVRSLFIGAEARPLLGVKLTIRATHTDAASYFVNDTRRTSRDTGDALTGTLLYSLGSKATATLDLENRKAFHWLGPSRTGSYNDEDKKIRFAWNQTLTKTLQLTLQSGISLTQSFYVDADIDRDRDQGYQFANLRLTSKMHPKLSTGVYVAVTKTDYVNVKASLSQNNRAETQYELRPEFTYKITNRVDLTQRYGLIIQYADFVFQENENFLDRNLTFSNQLKARLTTALNIDFYYALQLHDKGSYLRPTPEAERVLTVNQEERRDEVKIRFRYQLSRHLALTGLNEYSQRKDLRAPNNANSTFKDGGVEIGVDGNYDLGANRVIKFNMRRVKRFGRFNVEAQKDYWVMDSSINYMF